MGDRDVTEEELKAIVKALPLLRVSILPLPRVSQARFDKKCNSLQILQLPQNFYLADTTWGKLLQVKYLPIKV